ncbi:MAG: hypothetical protein P9M06_01945 [Candidatus Saelkia tenebricola]|nr:hypothetical protein [Candidatus Saelkia tenebricola]
MKKYLLLLTTYYLLLTVFTGCASTKHQIKATSPDTEVVEAEGMGPIVEGDILSAKKTSLHDALKNALGLVIGIYVSKEALVSKALLIEDNITSETEGYIEKYDILKEWQEDNFYKTRIKALVRKEDLSEKLRALELEPKKLGNPVVKFSIEEFIDGNQSDAQYAEGVLKNKFIEQGFVVSDSGTSDILITGKAESIFNSDSALGGLLSYRASISVKAVKSNSQEVIKTAQATTGGVDITEHAAAQASIINAAKKVGKSLPSTILKYLKERSVVQLTVSNVENINILDSLNRSIRALIEVRDTRVRNFSNKTAIIDLDLKKGTTDTIARRLERNSNFKIKITKKGAYNIEAELQ